MKVLALVDGDGVVIWVALAKVLVFVGGVGVGELNGFSDVNVLVLVLGS